MPTVYCVEDDDSIRELVAYTLGSVGLEARGFPSGSEFREAFEAGRPDVVLLDLMLPGENGLSLLKYVRARQGAHWIPVMIISAKGTEYDKVLGLDSGADDYLAKPFGMMELISRVKALLRRRGESASESSGTITFGSIEIDRNTHTIAVCGEPVALTLKEFDLLVKFAQNPGRIFAREELLSAVWGHAGHVETRTVDVHVACLRQKLGAAGDMIRTVRGVGYGLENPSSADS